MWNSGTGSSDLGGINGPPVRLATYRSDQASGPVSGHPAPCTATRDPVSRHPVIPHAFDLPVPRIPHVLAVFPAPVAVVPHIPHASRRNGFNAHRRRRIRRHDNYFSRRTSGYCRNTGQNNRCLGNEQTYFHDRPLELVALYRRYTLNARGHGLADSARVTAMAKLQRNIDVSCASDLKVQAH